ncbi:MAG: long-chain fatty aldehyde decarbonylase [bacterium]|nr:long-chain fatty aldehyde decarbonylase [bacterium]
MPSIAQNQTKHSPEIKRSMEQLMGLAVFGEAVAAKNYLLMAQLKPEYSEILKKFASMEAQHASWFKEGCKKNDVIPDKEFADGELGYLIDQVQDHFNNKNFEALAVLQGFIVESLAIATYEPYLDIADRFPGTREAFKRALEEERYHVSWIIRYFRLRFFDAPEEFLQLTEQTNVQGVDCVGGTMMNIVDALTTIGLKGADCAGRMIECYTSLLEEVGIDAKKAEQNVIKIFIPVIRKYRRGERTK